MDWAVGWAESRMEVVPPHMKSGNMTPGNTLACVGMRGSRSPAAASSASSWAVAGTLASAVSGARGALLALGGGWYLRCKEEA